MSLESAFSFIFESEKLKAVERQTYPIGIKRHENSAEHSWSLAIAAMVLIPEINPSLDQAKVIEMLLLHDLVEIDAGDTFCYGDQTGKVAAEEQAANRIFSLLPIETNERFRNLWVEFESRETPEALFANALDRLFPLLQNSKNAGGSWTDHGIAVAQVVERNQQIELASPELWDYAKKIIAASVKAGWLKP